MRVTLDALVVLDAIDRAGSFAAAAEQLFRVPSAVSYTVHKLEQDLGVTLFDRSGHRAKLTAAGSCLLNHGRELLRRADEAERRTREVGAGWEARLTISVADVVSRSGVYPMLRAFYATPGHESTHVDVTTESQATCWDALLAGRCDLVIGAPEPGPDVDGVQSRTLGEVQLSLVVPPGHPLADVAEPLSNDTLASYRVVRQGAWPFGVARDEPHEDLVTVDSYASQVEAIRHGVGIGYAPAYLVHDDVALGRLVAKTVSHAPRLRVSAAWRENTAGRGLRWFLDQLGDESLRSRLVPPA